MQFTWIDGVVLVVYFASMVALGLYQTRKIKNTGDFFAGGRKFNKFLMMMHALGSGTHADDPVGVTGASFKYGIAGIWYTFVYLFVTPFYWLMAPLFRRSRYLTTADFFEARFGSKLGTLYAIWGIIIFSVNIGTLLIGTGKIVDAVSMGTVEPTWGIIGMTVAFLIYGTAGGLVATVVTESVQGLLIVVMSLMLVPYGLMKVGGFAVLHQTLNKSHFNLAGLAELSVGWIVAGTVINLINIVAQPHTMEVCSTGKTEFEGRIGFTYGNFVKRICAIGWALTGVIMIALVMQGEVPSFAREDAFGTAIRVLLPAGLGLVGLMFAAILAAQMSTLSAFMVAASALFSRNIYKRHFNPTVDDAKLLSVARYGGLVIVALGVLFAFCVKGVADALMWFWTLTMLPGLFMWAGVLWRRTNAAGAWASFSVMLLIWLVLCEPGNAISMAMGKKAYKPLEGPAAMRRMADDAQPVTRIMLDVVKVGKKGPERKDLQLIISNNNRDKLGMKLRELTDEDREKLNLIPGREGALVDKPVSGVMVTNVTLQGVADHAELREGYAILQTSKLNTLGIYADKSLLQFRALALLPVGILFLILGSLFGKPHPKEELDKFYALITTPVGKEDELAKKGVEVVFAGASKGHPWELKHQKLVNIGGFVVALMACGLILLLLWGLMRIGA